MSTVSRNIELDEMFTDAKYGVDVVVKHFNDSIVLVREIETENVRVCGREEFEKGEGRFVKNE